MHFLLDGIIRAAVIQATGLCVYAGREYQKRMSGILRCKINELYNLVVYQK